MAFTKVVGPGIHTLAQLRTHNIHSAGIITATKFVGEMESGGGSSTFENVTVNGNLTVQGDTTTLNTTLRNVELLRVAADSGEPAGIITQTGAGDLLRLYDGTSQRVTVDDTGKVGIGTTVPTNQLHAVVDASAATPLLLERTHNNNVTIQYKNSTSRMFAGLAGDALGWGVDEDENIGDEPMFIVRRDSGKIGIGTTNPVSMLHINSGAPRITMSDSGTGAHHRINADSSVGNFNFDIDYDSITSIPAFIVNIKGGEKLRVASDGNIFPGSHNSQSIGSGTTAFSSVWASTRFRGNDDVKLILGNSQDLVIRHDGSNNIIGSPQAGDLQIKSGTSDNDNQLISSFQHGTGSVGIGTTYSYGKLDINTGSAVNGATDWYGNDFGIVIKHSTGASPNDEGNGICFAQPYYTNDSNLIRTGAIIGYKQSGNGSFGGGLIFKAQQNGANSLIESFRISQDGNVGINRVNPNQRLNVSGNIEVNAYDNRNGQDGYYLPKGLIIGNAYDAEKLVGVNSVTDDRNAIIWQERGLDLDFATSDTWRMKLTYDGKLGIGVTNPNDTVHVYHATDNYVARFESGDAGGGIVLKDNTHATTLLSNNGAFEIDVDNGSDLSSGESIAFKISGSEKLFINSGGDVILGGQDAVIEPGGYQSHLEIHGTATDAGASIVRYSANAGGPTLLFGKSRNATIGSITKVVEDDNLGKIEFYGVDTDWEPGASIRAFADGEWRSGSVGSEDNTDSPGRLEFHTTPNGSDNLQERVRIKSTGDVEIRVDGNNGTSSQQGVLRFFRTGYSADMNDSRIVFDTSAGTNNTDNATYCSVIAGKRTSSNNGSSDLRFYTCNSSNSYVATERLLITETGDVAITTRGTVEGVSKLNVEIPARTTAFDASDGDTWHDVLIENPGGAENNAVGLCFQVTGDSYHKNAGTGIAAVKNGTNSDYGADLVFITRPQNAVAEERLRIKSDGKVGIGNTTSPPALLTVHNGTNDAQFVQMRNEELGLFFGAYGTGSSYAREATINGSRSDAGSSPYLRVAGQGGIKFCADLNNEKVRIGTNGVVHVNSVAGGQAVVALGDPDGNSFRDQNRIGGDTVVVANDAISGAIYTPRKGCFVMITSFKEANSTDGIYPQPNFSGMAYVDDGPSRNVYICNLGTNVGTDLEANDAYDGDYSHHTDNKVTIMGGDTEGTFRIVNRANAQYRFQVTFL